MRYLVSFILLLVIAGLAGCTSAGSAIPVSTGQENASYLQMGEFPDKFQAEQLLERTTKIGVSAFIVEDAGLYQVKSGPYADADQALRHKQELDRALDIEARVVFE